MVYAHSAMAGSPATAYLLLERGVKANNPHGTHLNSRPVFRKASPRSRHVHRPLALLIPIHLHQGLQYKNAFPSAPPVNNQGWFGWKTTHVAPSPVLFLACPLRIFTGTIIGLVIRSLKTFPWNTWVVPSSLADANNG